MNQTAKIITEFIYSVPVYVVWLLLLVTFTIVAIMTMILAHHWKEYGSGFAHIRKGRSLYLSGIIILSLLSILSAIMFTFTI